VISLSISAINAKSPYKLVQTGKGSFLFETDYGNIYEIGLVEELMFNTENTYQLFLRMNYTKRKVSDPKIKEVITVILEEFFKNEYVFLDYICDNSDDKQAARHRLFLKWFHTYSNNSLFKHRELNLEYENVTYYATVIIKKDNPLYSLYKKAVDKFENELFAKFTNTK